VSRVARYKVDVEVVDGDEAAKFVFWDSSLEELLGMTAATLLEKQCQVTIRSLIHTSHKICRLIHNVRKPFCIIIVDLLLFSDWVSRPTRLP
jgi:hypothetical protein